MAAVGKLSDWAFQFYSDAERRLRSQNRKERFIAVALLSVLLDSTPSVAIINSTFLKLADVFVQCNDDLLRLIIYDLVSLHADKFDFVLNKEAFLRRIVSSLSSPSARTRMICVSLLRSLASALSGYVEFQHRIWSAVSSPSRHESQFALTVIVRVCAYDADLAKILLSKISRLLHDSATDPELKLRLVPAIHYMLHSADLSLAAFSVGQEYLLSSREDVVAVKCIQSLSALSRRSPFLVSNQLMPLLANLTSSAPSSIVRSSAHEELCKLVSLYPSFSDLLGKQTLVLSNTPNVPPGLLTATSVEAMQTDDDCSNYQDACRACAKGRYSDALPIFTSLKSEVITEKFRSWFSCLESICHAELSLESSQGQKVDAPVTILQQAFTHLLNCALVHFADSLESRYSAYLSILHYNKPSSADPPVFDTIKSLLSTHMTTLIRSAANEKKQRRSVERRKRKQWLLFPLAQLSYLQDRLHSLNSRVSTEKQPLPRVFFKW